MAIIWFIFIIFPCHCAVYMYKNIILQKPLNQFHPVSHWSFCWNVIDSLFKWSCSIDCQAHVFFFKTKNCSYDDIFISCDDRIGKMLHNICMSAVAMSLRWANRGPWASWFFFFFFFFSWTRTRYAWTIAWTNKETNKWKKGWINSLLCNFTSKETDPP